MARSRIVLYGCLVAAVLLAQAAVALSVATPAAAAPAGRLRVNHQHAASANVDGYVLLDVNTFAATPPVLSFELYQSPSDVLGAAAAQRDETAEGGSATLELYRLHPLEATAAHDGSVLLATKTVPFRAFASVTRPSPLVVELTIPLDRVFPASFLAPHFVYKWRVVTATRQLQRHGADTTASTAAPSPFAFFRIAKAFTGAAAASGSQGQWIERVTTENLFRVSFTAPATFKAMTLYASGVGTFEAYVNGKRVNNHVLEPGTTDFAVYSLATHDDVSSLIVPGQQNTLGFMLGNGWYGMPQGYGKTPKLNFELIDDNSIIVAWSSPATVTVATGPIAYDSIYNGETYNCAKEIHGWNLPAYSFSGWPQAKAVSLSDFNPIVKLRDFPAIRINETLTPVATTYPAAGIAVVDFGREVSGFCEIVVQGAGSIWLHHGEIMDHYNAGMEKFVYFGNLRSALATDTYTSCGVAGVNYTYQPRFTYHGFRFVQINTTGNLTLVSIKAHGFFSAVTPVSTFASSHPTLNTLHQHVLWGQSANLMSYPSDCDQRDERLGWMADGWLSSDEAISNFDMQGFYKNWVSIMIADQVDGKVGDVSPYIRYGSRPADPTWGMALPYVANQIWLTYADTGVLAPFYNASLQWVQYLATREATSGMGSMYAFYGDWVPPPPAAKASNSFVSAFSLVYSTQLVLNMAVALNREADVAMLQKQLDDYLTAFNAAWFNSSAKSYDKGVQTTFALPMAILGLVPFDVALGLLAEVESTKFHLDTGIVGVRFLFDALSQTGHSDAALETILQETYPGFAYEWNNGVETPATTLWELWDAPVEGPGMNSRNHIMDGSVDTWMHRHVGGIQQTPSSVGFRSVTLHADVAEFYSPVRASNASRRILRGGGDAAADTVAFAWARHGGAVCEKAVRGRPLALDCGARGGVLASIDFVSVGNPTGMCHGYTASADCHTNSSLLRKLQTACLGRAACSLGRDWWETDAADIEALEVDRQAFAGAIGTRLSSAPANGHCAESHLTAAIRATCSAPVAFTVTATVPAHTVATVAVPTFAVANPAVRMTSSLPDADSFVAADAAASSINARMFTVMTNDKANTLEIVVHTTDGAAAATVLPLLDAMRSGVDGRLARLDRTHGIPLTAVARIQRACVGESFAAPSTVCVAALDGASASAWRHQLQGIFV